jgi:hypothetical protein
VTDHEAPSRDFDDLSDDLDEGGWFGHVPFVQEPKTEPIPLTPELTDSPPQPEHHKPERISVHPDLIERSAAEHSYQPDRNGVPLEPDYEPRPALPEAESQPNPEPDPRWTTNGQLRVSGFGRLEFKSARTPWFRSRKAMLGLLTAVVLIVAVVLVSLALHSADDTTGPAPAPSTGAVPSKAPAIPSAVEPSLTSTPAPPPPPLPPPPPPAPPPPPDNAPVYTRQYQPPRRADPPAQQKPSTGVTRAPISVAPGHTAVPSGPEVGKHGANNDGW